MGFKTYVGKLTVLGDSVSSVDGNAALRTYSYVELETGELIRKLRTLTGLDGHLKSAFQEGEVTELHVNEAPAGSRESGAALLAIRRANGRLYASQLTPLPFALTVAPVLLFIAGLFTIWIFGLGLVGWYFAWKIHKINRQASETALYIRGLNGAIEI